MKPINLSLVFSLLSRETSASVWPLCTLNWHLSLPLLLWCDILLIQDFSSPLGFTRHVLILSIWPQTNMRMTASHTNFTNWNCGRWSDASLSDRAFTFLHRSFPIRWHKIWVLLLVFFRHVTFVWVSFKLALWHSYLLDYLQRIFDFSIFLLCRLLHTWPGRLIYCWRSVWWFLIDLNLVLVSWILFCISFNERGTWNFYIFKEFVPRIGHEQFVFLLNWTASPWGNLFL